MNRQNPLLLTLIAVFGVTFQAHALEHWFIPIESELKTVSVVNFQSQAQTVWLSTPIRSYEQVLEQSLTIPANGKIEIPLSEYPQEPWIHLKAQIPAQLQVQVQTSSETVFSVPSSPASRWQGRAHPRSVALILNQSPYPQRVSVTAEGSTEIVTVAGFSNHRLDLSRYSPASMLEIEGEGRISGFIVAGRDTQSMIPVETPRRMSPPAFHSRYFLMSNGFGTQSFVTEISNPEMISAAQAQILSPWLFLPRILIAKVQPGHQELNRDFSDPRKTPWSWHVSKAIAFSEIGLQDCDGSPEMLEEMLQPWIANGTSICFWSYRIKRELSIEEIRTGYLNEFELGREPSRPTVFEASRGR